MSLHFCLAHLIRDVKFLTTLPEAGDRHYGERLRQALRDLFAVFHQRPELAPGVLATRRLLARLQVVRVGRDEAPATRPGPNMAKRFREHGEAYFTFLTTPGVEPTNNLAEPAIRFVVIARHITQGTRGARGRRWSERIWTVMARCVQQGQSLYSFLGQAVEAWFANRPAPSLVPASSRG